MYNTAEAAFQAAKVSNPITRYSLGLHTCETGAEARKLGRKVKLRPDWEQIKFKVMKDVLVSKFSLAETRNLLLATEGAYLEEGNSHNDCIWGVVKGKGSNMLGILLMEVRSEIQSGVHPELSREEVSDIRRNAKWKYDTNYIRRANFGKNSRT